MTTYQMTRNVLENLQYGRGRDRMIRGARYAVVGGPSAHPEAVLSTHRTIEAAENALRRASRTTGVLHIAEIVNS